MGTARSIGILTILNVVGAAIGLLNTAVVAFFFRTTRAVEVYFAAAGLQASVVRLTQTGQISEIFLPIYHRIRHDQGADQAHGAFSIIVNWMVLVTAGLSVGFWFATSALIRLRVPGFAESDLATGARIFRALIPIGFAQVLAGLIQTLANAERWFGAAEAIAVFSRLAIVLTIVLLAPIQGVWALVTAQWIGSGMLVVGLAVFVVRKGFRYRFRLHQDGFSPRVVFRKLFATFGYAGTTQVYLFSLDAALSMLPQGVFAAFRYAMTLFAKTQSVLLRPIGTVFFTHFSEALVQGAGSLRDLSRSALAKGLAVSSLAIAAIWVSGRLLLGGLWGAHRFGIEPLNLATLIVGLLFILTLTDALGLIARKTGVSVGLVTQQYLFASVAQLVNAGAIWTFTIFFATNGAVVALVGCTILTSVAYLAALLIWRRDLVAVYEPKLLLQWGIAVAGGIGTGRLLGYLTGGNLVTGRWERLGVGIGLATVAMVVTVCIAWMLNVYEAREGGRRLWAMVRRSRIRASET